MTDEIRTLSFGKECDTLRKRSRFARQSRYGRGPGPFDHPTKRSTRGRRWASDPLKRRAWLRGEPTQHRGDFVARINERLKSWKGWRR